MTPQQAELFLELLDYAGWTSDTDELIACMLVDESVQDVRAKCQLIDETILEINAMNIAVPACSNKEAALDRYLEETA